eukprot:SAG31_NODE_148_length_22511_cov_20.369266_1_plen_125_part_10
MNLLFAGLTIQGFSGQIFARIVASKSDSVLKATVFPMTYACIPMFMIGMFMGTVWFANHGPQFGESSQGDRVFISPFGGMVDDLLLLGGFGEFLGVTMMLCAVAGFMSTADSMVFAISTVISVNL